MWKTEYPPKQDLEIILLCCHSPATTEGIELTFDRISIYRWSLCHLTICYVQIGGQILAGE